MQRNKNQAQEDYVLGERTWTLHNPVGVRRQQPAPAPAAGSGAAALGFLSNRKPNTSALQRALAAALGGHRPDLEVHFYEKPSSAVAATGELLDRIGADCGLVVNGTGD
jgi:hypothetical protein